MKVGLIGLGIMGKPMAKNLLKAGYDLTVSNRNKAAADEVGCRRRQGRHQRRDRRDLRRGADHGAQQPPGQGRDAG